MTPSQRYTHHCQEARVHKPMCFHRLEDSETACPFCREEEERAEYWRVEQRNALLEAESRTAWFWRRFAPRRTH